MELNDRRMRAFVIDTILCLALVVIPTLLAMLIPRLAVIVPASFAVSSLYQIFRDGFRGQSVGKKMMKIRLIHKADRLPIGFGIALLRGFLTCIPFIGWIDFLLILFTREGQRSIDRFLGVELVKDEDQPLSTIRGTKDELDPLLFK